MFIHFFCLCPLSLTIMLNFDISKVAYWIPSGAMIGDGDRKSWDPGAPIWDNFSIFRTNRAILTSYIRVDPRTYRGLSRGCCLVA